MNAVEGERGGLGMLRGEGEGGGGGGGGKGSWSKELRIVVKLNQNFHGIATASIALCDRGVMCEQWFRDSRFKGSVSSRP